MITLRGLVFNNNKKQIITAFFMLTLRVLVFYAERVGILR